MAQKPKKKVAGFVKLQIPAGKATPAPPVGPALGQHGINIAAFDAFLQIWQVRKQKLFLIVIYV